jgi:transcriptional regulator with XRE-family HTH domain
MDFAEKLRALRNAAGLSEVALAERAGLPFGTLHGYAIGRRAVPAPALFALARALRVSVEVFGECYVPVQESRGK